jgi:hypothetical protein
MNTKYIIEILETTGDIETSHVFYNARLIDKTIVGETTRHNFYKELIGTTSNTDIDGVLRAIKTFVFRKGE